MKLAHDLFYLDLLFFGQGRIRSGQQIENGQLLLGQLFPYMSRLLLVERTAQFQQLFKEFLNAAAAAVVGFDQLLKLVEVVRAGSVDPNQFVQLGTDGGFQHFQVGVLGF